jgi:hypothetical protein
MAVEKPQRQFPIRSVVRMAIAAVQGSGHPLDIDAGDPDTAPTSLGLPAPQGTVKCSHHRYVCAVCGKPLRPCLK